MQLHGKSILVVGGSSGIGLAVASGGLDLGAAVTIASRSMQKLDRAQETLGRRATGLQLDVTSDESIERAFGHGDHVIVTAADIAVKAVRDWDVPDAQAAMNSKFWGFYRIARSARIREGGSLGVVAGFRSHRPAAGQALMSAINAALEGLVRGLALDLRPIRVNAVSPAMVDTPLWSRMEPLERQAMMARLAALYPAGVVGKPQNIAQMMLALASNPYATGSIVTLDGGASLV